MTFADRPNGLPHCPSTQDMYLVRLGSHIEVYINSKLGRAPPDACQASLRAMGDRHPQL